MYAILETIPLETFTSLLRRRKDTIFFPLSRWNNKQQKPTPKFHWKHNNIPSFNSTKKKSTSITFKRCDFFFFFLRRIWKQQKLMPVITENTKTCADSNRWTQFKASTKRKSNTDPTKNNLFTLKNITILQKQTSKSHQTSKKKKTNKQNTKSRYIGQCTWEPKTDATRAQFHQKKRSETTFGRLRSTLPRIDGEIEEHGMGRKNQIVGEDDVRRGRGEVHSFRFILF